MAHFQYLFLLKVLFWTNYLKLTLTVLVIKLEALVTVLKMESILSWTGVAIISSSNYSGLMYLPSTARPRLPVVSSHLKLIFLSHVFHEYIFSTHVHFYRLLSTIKGMPEIKLISDQNLSIHIGYIGR